MEKAAHPTANVSNSNIVGNDLHLNSPPPKIRRVEMPSLSSGVPDGNVNNTMEEDEDYHDSKDSMSMSGNARENNAIIQVGTKGSSPARQNDSQTGESSNADYFDVERASDYSESMNEANMRVSLPSKKPAENGNDTKEKARHLDLSATNVIGQKNQGTQSPLLELDENEIFKILGCNTETKTPEKLLEEYFDNEPSRRLTESFFRKAIPAYLKSSLEDYSNRRSYNELMERIKNADFLSLMKTFTAMLDRNSDNSLVPQSPFGLNDESEDIIESAEEYAETESPLPVQVPLCFSQEIQTDDLQSNDVGVQVEVGADKDAIYHHYLDKLDESLFTDMRAESGRETSHEKKIPIIGKMLFMRYFSEQEILEGFKRKQCKQDGTETQAYDVKRVFIISQVIKFMLNETKITAENFKSTIYENQGLEGKEYDIFNKTVMVDYANVQRNKIKKTQDRRRRSSAAN